jgi:membrane glycosyltransferase
MMGKLLRGAYHTRRRVQKALQRARRWGRGNMRHVPVGSTLPTLFHPRP